MALLAYSVAKGENERLGARPRMRTTLSRYLDDFEIEKSLPSRSGK